ncbi:hypothetical protein [Devosia sp. SL43]|uniref:hypothetical protein n=1 Tax=Devosia sp. SL43 TaxID=2806348 RepID=UPI001F15BF68|nr:hypothetical protein [Devosia sp. SL43]UJW87944.1 hypothetical protein IM737_20535 [Devosia sp. SL43]
MLPRIWEVIVRWRTYLLNIVLALAFILPEVLNSPEILAVIPPGYQRWFLVAAFLLNIWMRPRPASIASDPEVQVRKVIEKTDDPSTIKVIENGQTKATIHA